MTQNDPYSTEARAVNGSSQGAYNPGKVTYILVLTCCIVLITSLTFFSGFAHETLKAKGQSLSYYIDITHECVDMVCVCKKCRRLTVLHACSTRSTDMIDTLHA